jgi:phage repressor protein C with HTH and peptisase S24 domain
MMIVRRIVGNSMLPVLRPGGIVVGWGRPKKLAIGDIVIVQHEGLEKIKRISQIEDGKLYVLGDNPEASKDSRHFGWLDLSTVQAKLVWPIRKK